MVITNENKNEKENVNDQSEQEESFAERVRFLRKKKGWTLNQLSETSGVSRATLSKIENGKNPMFDTVIRLADAFGVSTDYLAGIDNLSVKDISKSIGLDEAAVNNIYDSFQEGSLIDEEHSELTIDEPPDGYIPPYVPGFCPENESTNNFNYELHAIDIITTYYGEKTAVNILSPEGMALYNKYKGCHGREMLFEHYVTERMTEGYLKYTDHFVANRILTDWKLFRMISNYIRSINATEVEGPAKIEETDIITKAKIMSYLEEMRDFMRKESPFAVPCFSEEDSKSIYNTYQRIPKKVIDNIEKKNLQKNIKEIFDEDDPFVKKLLGDNKE